VTTTARTLLFAGAAALTVAAPAQAIRVSAIKTVMTQQAARYAHQHHQKRAGDVRPVGHAVTKTRGRGCVTFLSGSDRVRIAGDVLALPDGRYAFENGVTIKVAHDRRQAC
jgi:hypothetical protein